MTDKILNEYYIQHKDIYMSLAMHCTSVPEILLKLDIYGKKWTQWDWVLLFSSIINQMFVDKFFNEENSCKFLYEDILYSIDNTDQLDKILTNKQVILSIIYILNGNMRFISYKVQTELCGLLAHIFKKFPRLWNMSWMFAKHKNSKQHKWEKYHRLSSSVNYSNCAKDIQYFKSKQYYADFMSEYLK